MISLMIKKLFKIRSVALRSSIAPRIISFRRCFVVSGLLPLIQESMISNQGSC